MYEETKDKPEHTVQYTSIDYHSMCQKSKAKIRAMQDMGGAHYLRSQVYA